MKEQITLRIKRDESAAGIQLPEYQTEYSSGMDVRAAVQEPFTLLKGKVAAIPTGLYMEIPEGYEIQVRPRSGLALKHGIAVLNSPGTIDADYRGEVKIILMNLGEEDFIIERGDRIAQLVVQKVMQADILVVEEITETARASGGFGHTGKK